jgi:hypothetical protein
MPLLAVALAAVIATGGVATRPARAGLICHTIPRVVEAVDVKTGGPYMAPPVPYGHYAKDYLAPVANGLGMVHGCLSGLLHGCCKGCGGAGCGLCGGTGKCGHLGSGSGLQHGDPCGVCGGMGNGCGFCGWKGLLHGHGNGPGCGDPGIPCGGGLCSPQHAPSKTCSVQQPQPQSQSQPQRQSAQPQSAVKVCSFDGHASTVAPSAQAPLVSPQDPGCSVPMGCARPGCKLLMRHFHRMGQGCSACNGQGCGICHGGGMLSGNLCDGCHGRGCGLCGGLGLLKHGLPCGACGGKGCGLCGAGHKLLGLPGALFAKVFHIGDIDYFVGPGGPVPLTPGYVPYVVPTRSPRDFFAFPPFSDLDP